jgi:hypothetical protein
MADLGCDGQVAIVTGVGNGLGELPRLAKHFAQPARPARPEAMTNADARPRQ